MGAACSKAAVRSEVSPRGVQAPRLGKAPDPVREPQQHDSLEAHAALTRGDGTKAPAASAATAAPSAANAPRAPAADVPAKGELSQVEVHIKVTAAKQELSRDVDAQEASADHAAAAAASAANAAQAADAPAADEPAKGKGAPEVLAEGMVEAVESKIPDVEQLVERLKADQGALKVDQLAAEALKAAPGIMGLLDKAVAAYQEAKAKGNPPPAVQQLQVQELNYAQQTFIRYSAVGKLVLEVAGAAMSSLPFGAPVAALMGAIYGKAVQCVENSQNCYLLVQQIKRCDTQLARVVVKMSSKQQEESSSSSSTGCSSLSEGVLEGVASLHRVIQDSATAIAQYSTYGCVVRFFTSGCNEKQFQQLEEGLHKAMQQISFAVAIETLAMANSPFKDESAALRAAVCEAVSLPQSQAEQALKQLSEQDPAKLKALLKQHGSFSAQVVDQEVKALEVRVITLESAIAGHAKTIQQLVEWAKRQEGKGPDGMADFITQWWTKAVGKYQTSLAWPRFKLRLLESLAPDVEKCVRLLAEEAEDNKWTLPADCSPKEVFLDKVLLPLLDTDGDQHITRSELKALQAIGQTPTANEFGAPADMGELLELVHVCHDRNRLQVDLTCASKRDAVAAKLQAGDIIKSYNTARLLDDYLPGTRTWLFDEITAWRAAAAQQQDSSSRMFLLLADAGMGKSVCSAVLLKHLAAANAQVAAANAKRSQPVVAHHFFKVGQQRGEGKAMIRCLAQQLCGSLPGLAREVEQQVQDLPDLASLSMLELFDKLLLNPLQELDKNFQEKPECLLLLDALDESNDSNQGWQPVCNLVATQFQRLPSWVCVLVTGRPQVESRFANWKPAKWIATTDEQNQNDLHRVLLAKLKLSKLVDDSLVNEASSLLLKKSQGQFIYAKYVFITLEQQAHWSLEQLEELPDGLQQVYCCQLDTILAALKTERPELAALFKECLLPMLAVMKEALPVHVLTWLVQGNHEEVHQGQVALLLRLLYSLFPSRTGADGSLEVAPYHKSIQDFLLCDSDQRAASAAELKWKTPAAGAHRLFVSRLLPELQKPQLTHWQDACGPQVLRELPAAQQYCLQYAVDHIALAKDWAALHQLLRHLPGLKAVLEVPGQVYKLSQVLAEAAVDSQAEESQVFVGVQRFLRTASSLISQDPHSVLQEMAYSPRDCVLGDLCEQHFKVKQAIADGLQHHASIEADFWRGALLSPLRAANSPAEVALLQGHTGSVLCCAISPDGEAVVSGSCDKNLKVWELSTGRLRTTLEGHEEEVTCCAITPDGRLLVSGSVDATLMVWDLPTGQLLTTLTGHNMIIQCCAISPDGKTLVSGSTDNTLKVWDLPGGQLHTTLQQEEECVSCCSISPDGQTLVSGHINGKVVVWNLLTGQARTTLEAHEGRVAFCAISPDGQLLVTGRHCLGDDDNEDDDSDKNDDDDNDDDDDDGNDNDDNDDNSDEDLDGDNDANDANDGNSLKVWDLSTGTLRTSLAPAIKATSCVISPDMMVIAACWRPDYLYVWDLPSGQLHTKLGGAGLAACCAISPDGQTLVSGSVSNHTLTVWDLPAALKAQGEREPAAKQQPVDKQEPEQKQEQELEPAVVLDHLMLCGAVSSHNLVLGLYSGLQVWDLPSGQLRTFEKEQVWCCAISPDGQTLVCGSLDKPIKVWDLASGQLRTTLDWECNNRDSYIISSDGKTLVGAYLEGKLEEDEEKGEVEEEGDKEEEGEEAEGGQEAGDIDDAGSSTQESECSPQKGELHVWDLPTGQLRTKVFHEDGILSCSAVSADGRWLVSGSSHNVKVWDLATGKENATLVDGAGAQCCAISPDGQLLVCGFYCGPRSASDNIKVWDLRTGQLLMAMRGHHGNITCCNISLDGKTLTTCSYAWDERTNDQAVQVWDLLTGKEHSKVEQRSDRVILSPDGQLLVCSSVFCKLQRWVLMGKWQQGPAPPPYDEAMSLHRWCPGAPGFYLL